MRSTIQDQARIRQWSGRLVRHCTLAATVLMATRLADAQQFTVTVRDPAFPTGSGPRVLWDMGHFNDHYWGMEAFLEVLQKDGFQVAFHRAPFDAASLREIDLLVLPGPLALSRDSLLAKGVHHYQWSDEGRSQALSNTEVVALTTWIRAGGGLLLILDHAPQPAASGRLLEALGVDVRNSMTWDHKRQLLDDIQRDNQRASRILFSRQRASLGDHAIMTGRNASEWVDAVATYVGASLVGPRGSTPLLLLSTDAFDYWKEPPERGAHEHRVPASGRAQATAFSLDKGRVAVVAEFTPFQARWVASGDSRGTIGAGMAYPGADDQQFVTNVARWLAKSLP